MIDGIATGYEHAVFALGWLLGVLPVLILTASTVIAAWALYRLLDHRLRVIRLRRQTRRSGRTVTRADAPPFPFPCHCASLPPGRRDLTGHEPDCPDHPR